VFIITVAVLLGSRFPPTTNASYPPAVIKSKHLLEDSVVTLVLAGLVQLINSFYGRIFSLVASHRRNLQHPRIVWLNGFMNIIMKMAIFLGHVINLTGLFFIGRAFKYIPSVGSPFAVAGILGVGILITLVWVEYAVERGPMVRIKNYVSAGAARDRTPIPLQEQVVAEQACSESKCESPDPKVQLVEKELL
jgi:hypothetical protein